MLKIIVYLDDDKLKYDEIWLVEFPATKSVIIEDEEYNYFSGIIEDDGYNYYDSKYYIVFDIIIVIDLCS